MQWLTELLDRWSIARAEQRHQHMIHNVRRTWTLSGVQVGAKNALSDAGLTELRNVTLDEARATLAAWYPRATVAHIDEENFIITYRVS